MNDSIANLIERAAAIQREGRAVYGCLLVKARGSTPQSAGALMLVDDNANTHGTIGGGCVEAEVRRQAYQMLAQNRSGVLSFKLDHDYGWDDGLICGGTIELAVGSLPDARTIDRIVSDIQERRGTALDVIVRSESGPTRFTLDLPPRDRLYVAGAGHVGQALARVALRLDFEVTLFDDRADMLQKYAPADCLTAPGSIADELERAPIDGRTYAVIVTRGHKNDEQALRAVVNRGAAYIGMIGSRRKVKLIFDDLIDRGVPAEALASVCAPIGLRIGAISVEEIAISIAAQLIEHRRNDRESPLHTSEPVAKTTRRIQVSAMPGA